MDNNILPKGIIGFGAGQSWAILYDQMPWKGVSNSESNYGTIPAGVTAFGAGQQWGLLYGQNPNVPFMPPYQPGKDITESQFDGELPKQIVGLGAGQDWALLYPSANSNYDGEGDEVNEEEDFVGLGIGAGILAKKGKIFKRSFCRKYVKSLGYLRRENLGGDKISYIQAINECLVNYKDIKAKKYKIKPMDKEGELVDVDKLVADTETETLPPMKESISDTSVDTGVDTGVKTKEEKSKIIIYVILAIVVVVIGVVLYKKYKK